jgi:hypothetical protein
MPFIPDEDALPLTIHDSMQEDARPFLIIRDRRHPIPENLDVDGCIPFDEAEADLGWLDPDTLRELRTAGHALFRPATPAAPDFNGTTNRARRRQVCVNSMFLAAAQARADEFPDNQLAVQALHRWPGIANNVFPLAAQELNVRHDMDDSPDCRSASVIENVVHYNAIYHRSDFNIDFMGKRLHAAAMSAVEAVTREYGDVATPLQAFLPRQNALRFRTILLRAFHGSHSAAWYVASLEPIAAALRVVTAVGRLARDQRVPLTAGLVRDMRQLRDPWMVNDVADQGDVHDLYMAIERFVKAIIGADECADLAKQQLHLIPDKVWTPPRQFLPLLPELKFGWLQS